MVAKSTSVSSVKCPACLSEKYSNIGEKNGFMVQCCNKCRAIFTEIAPENSETNEKVKELYAHYYDAAKFKLRKATEVSLQNYLDSFKRFKQTKNILDIGFGEGGLLSVAEKNGWMCYGTELAPQSLEYGEKRGWVVSEDALSDNRFVNNSFDVVTMIEIIEHLPEPDSFLKFALDMLRPGGLLFLTTPNAQSINKRLLGIDWSMVAPPEHIVIWSPSGMKHTLKRNNLSAKRIRTGGFNPIEILSRLRPRKGEEKSTNRNEVGFALNNYFTSSSWKRMVKLIINHGLSFLSLGDSIKVWAVKK